MNIRKALLIAAVAALAWPAAGQAQTTTAKQMAGRIATRIKESGELSNYRVGVKFEDGVAVLLGNVTDAEQEAAALRLAREVEGVAKVVSNLEVANAGAPVVTANAEQDPQQPDAADLLLNLAESTQPADIKTPAITEPAPLPVAQPVARQATRRGALRRTTPNNRRALPQPFARTARRPARAARGPAQQGVRQANFGAAGPGVPQGQGYGQGFGPAGAAGGVQGVQYENPNLPNYAWPSYAAHPNYAALTYPKQYSPSAWPYIGPFYPYPQVPLGWRKVALEWDDGWWFLDFSHHQRH